MTTRWWDRFARLFGREPLPEGFTGRLDATERVLATAKLAGGSSGGDGGDVVATSHGLWLPDGRRVGWHLVSKATWTSGALVIVEAEEVEPSTDLVLLRDLPPRRLPLAEPGSVPQVVHERVTKSIRSRHHRELPGGGAWFVQRAIPGRNGLVLQVRPDPGADWATVRRVAARVAVTMRQVGQR